jgi:hypothetical protein
MSISISYGPGATEIDAQGDVYTITTGNQLAVNGVIEKNTSNVDALTFYNGSIYQKNSHNLWYSQSSPTASWVDYPAGTLPVPITVSANDTTVGIGSGLPIIDANGNLWTIDSGEVAMDGIKDTTTNSVVGLAYVNGNIWQENSSSLWWEKTPTGWGPVNGTPVPPIVPANTSFWVGGNGNNASNPKNWSSGLPKAGEQLQMAGNGIMNISGNALLSDNLYMSGVLNTNTLNVNGSSSFTTSGNSADTTIVNLAAISQWAGGFDEGYPGNSITIQGAGMFNNTQNSQGGAIINVDVIGTGAFTTMGPHGAGTIQFMKAVAATQVISSSGDESYGACGSIVVGDPTDFHASISMGFAIMTLQNLTADSYSLLNGVLSLYAGKAVVDTIRINLTPVIGNGTTPINLNFGVSQVGSSLVAHNIGAYSNGIALAPHG